MHHSRLRGRHLRNELLWTICVPVMILSFLPNSFGMPSWYNCSSSSNCIAPGCVCASIAPPKRLSPSETPQFILLTHDDAINPFSNKVMRAVTDGRVNPNGCNAPATWFTLQQGSDCGTVKRLWEDNHEIALHTVNHVALYINFEGKKEEMLGVRQWLNQTCGIPLEDLVGYRVPYLVHNPEVRQIMYEAGLMYDASMISVFSEDSQVENRPGQRVFPFTMDHGIPIDCNWNYPDGQCNGSTEMYPGLWEVPLWELQNQAGDHLYTMDPEGDVLGLLQENFNMNYQNNRAPFGIFVHATWFDPYKTDAVNKFLDWAMSFPDVWVVTTTQLVKWMQNPVPTSQMADWLTCRPVNLTKGIAEARCQLYTVQEGDSSYSIAIKFGVVTEDMLAINPEIGDGDALVPGEELRIPPFDDDCVGDAVFSVTGPGQVKPTYKAPEESSSTEIVTPPSFLESSGINMTMMLEGRPQIAFQTDLEVPLEAAIARALDLDSSAVELITTRIALPNQVLNSTNSRRLSQMTISSVQSTPTPLTADPMSKPRVIADIQIITLNPVELAKNASKILSKGGEFDTDVLSAYQLSQYEEPIIVPYENDRPVTETTKNGTTSMDGGMTESVQSPGTNSATKSVQQYSLSTSLLVSAALFLLKV